MHIVQEMGGKDGPAMDRLIVVGGTVRNPFWMQNKADMAERPIEASEGEDAGPLGAAMPSRTRESPGRSLRARPRAHGVVCGKVPDLQDCVPRARACEPRHQRGLS